MQFTKMHGCGNDYIYVWLDDSIREDETYPACVTAILDDVPDDANPQLAEYVRFLSDRHFGIGGDGVIFMRRFPTIVADFEMHMYNADGSRGRMCGNGIRCVAAYVYERGLTGKDRLEIVSCGIAHTVFLNLTKDRRVESVSVNMGSPVLTLHEIPVAIPPDIVERTLSAYQPRPSHLIYCPLNIAGQTFYFTPVSFGNPHAVVFLPPDVDLDTFDVAGIGSRFEGHLYFPEGVNTEFAIVDDASNVRMRVWERGSGETLCCGTGCCAVMAAGVHTGLTGDNITVHAPGGDVECSYKRKENEVFMTGPATFVFDGEL